MAKKKKNKYSTKHGESRFSERMPEELKDHTSIIRKALQYGSQPNEFSGSFKHFLYGKAYSNRKRVKVYQGYIFIFFSTSSRLVTVYKVPDEYQQEENIYGVNVNDIIFIKEDSTIKE